MNKKMSNANKNTLETPNGGTNMTKSSKSSATTTETMKKETKIMSNNNNSIANTTINTSKEATTMMNNTFVNVPMIVKAVFCGITTADITKFFGLNSDEIAPSLDAYYTKHKVYAKRTLTQLRANDTRAAENSQNRKRVSFSEDLVVAALFLIQQGATMEDLSRCFNIKDKKTIKKWLLEKWPKAGKRHFALLLENEKQASQSTCAIMDPELPEEVTFESWYGSSPSVDCLISRYMDYNEIELAKDYCEQQGLSYSIAQNHPYINIQAALMGRPTVISNSDTLMDFCEVDCIPFLNVSELYSKVVTFEKGSLEFSSKVDFASFKKSKSGIFFARCEELMNELMAKFNAKDATCKLYVANKDNTYKDAPEQFGLKNLQTFIVTIKENGTFSSWKYQLSNGHFHEVGYATGPDYLKAFIIEKLA